MIFILFFTFRSFYGKKSSKIVTKNISKILNANISDDELNNRSKASEFSSEAFVNESDNEEVKISDDELFDKDCVAFQLPVVSNITPQLPIK